MTIRRRKRRCLLPFLLVCPDRPLFQDSQRFQEDQFPRGNLFHPVDRIRVQVSQLTCCPQRGSREQQRAAESILVVASGHSGAGNNKGTFHAQQRGTGLSFFLLVNTPVIAELTPGWSQVRETQRTAEFPAARLRPARSCEPQLGDLTPFKAAKTEKFVSGEITKSWKTTRSELELVNWSHQRIRDHISSPSSPGTSISSALFSSIIKTTAQYCYQREGLLQDIHQRLADASSVNLTSALHDGERPGFQNASGGERRPQEDAQVCPICRSF